MYIWICCFAWFFMDMFPQIIAKVSRWELRFSSVRSHAEAMIRSHGKTWDTWVYDILWYDIYIYTYCIILRCIILYYIMLYFMILYYLILYYIILFYVNPTIKQTKPVSIEVYYLNSLIDQLPAAGRSNRRRCVTWWICAAGPRRWSKQF